MGGLTTTGARDLLRVVLAPGWKLPAPGTIDAAQVDAAIAEIEATVPLAREEPKLDGPGAQALADALRPIGAKIMPAMEREASQVWRAAVVMALSDLPRRAALYGLRKAIHRPMQFLNEVDGVARELAQESIERQRLALHRLKMMRREIERAANPQPALEPPPPHVWTQEEVDATNATFRTLGLKTRYKLDGDSVADDREAMDEEERAREAERAKNIDKYSERA